MANRRRLFIVSSIMPGPTGGKSGNIAAFEEIVWLGMAGNDEAGGSLADTIKQEAGPDDTIWIRDCHLYPLTGAIRDWLPEIVIGLLVAPCFPSGEAFRGMSGKEQEALVLGMLGADLIGFDSVEEGMRFVQYVQKILPVENDHGFLRYGERLIKIGVFPAGVADGSFGGVRDFFDELRKIRMKQERFRARFFDLQSRDALLDRYRRAKKRLFLLDYDGTLTPIFNLPSLARPDNLLLDILGNIAQNRKNSVYIISGRDSATLDRWLGHLPVNIIAEHGVRIRFKGQGWEEQGGHVGRREAKDETGPWSRHEIGGGITVKGAAIREVLSMEDQDFILAIGDDKTDEDMFIMLADAENACTIKVGQEASFAQYNLQTPQMVISLLGNMNFLEQQSYK